MCLLICMVSVWASYNILTVSRFVLPSDKINSSFRIVMIADLHDHTFGRQNTSLVKKIAREQPDVICMVGDMINSSSYSDEIAVGLVEQLKEYAPVYYSMGNHELKYISEGHDRNVLFDHIQKAGAVVIDRTFEDIEVNGNLIRIGGMYEYGFKTSMQSDQANEAALKFLDEYLDTDRYMIMCAHVPGAFASWDYAGKYGIDLVLSGHLHGGQVIVPGVGGLYSQLEGFWPRIDYGQYDLSGADMIVTRGLSSNHKKLPRFNNLPEICVIDLIPESGQ